MIRLAMPFEFPSVKPTITILSKIMHENVDQENLRYIGPALDNWSTRSSVISLVT